MSDVAPVVQAQQQRGVQPMMLVTLLTLIILVIALVFFIVWASQPLDAPPVASSPDESTWVRSIYGWGDTPEKQFSQPTDVALADDGTIWATDPGNNRVLAFTPEGAFAGIIETGPSSSGPGMIARPEGVDVGENGNVYIADFANNKAMEFTPRGQFVREWEVPSPLDIDAQADRILISTIYGVAEVDPEGNFVRRWGVRGRGEEEFDVAHGIVASPDGSFFVADSQNSRVKRYGADGELEWIVGEPSPVGAGLAGMTGVPEVFQIPSGITIDGAGRIVVVDPFDMAIKVLRSSDGSVTATYGEYGPEDGRFIYPTGIDYDVERDWFVVADTANGRLQIIRLPGSGGDAIQRATSSLGGPTWLWLLPPLFLVLGVVFSWKAMGGREITLEYVPLVGQAPRQEESP